MKINILLPVYNDWESLNYLLEKIDNIKSNPEINFSTADITIIDDCSTLKPSLKKKFSNLNIKIVKLHNNHGNQKAISIGLRYLSENNIDFDFCIIMDSDGEDKAEDIIKLINEAKKNDKKIIFASRHRRNEGFFYKYCYFWYKIIFKILTGQKINFGNFSCLPKKLVEKVANLPTISFHYSASILKSKIPYLTIPCNKGKRYDGISQMKLNNILLHALKSMSIYYEEILIRFLILSTTGIIFSFFSIVIVFLVKYFAIYTLIGWASNMVIGLSIILIIFLFMFFACLLILINKNLYKNTSIKEEDYKSLISSVENF